MQPGETAVAPPDLEFALGQNLVLLRADGTKVYPPFLRWLVRGQKWWEQVSKFINVGAVFDSLKCAEIPDFELRIPPMLEQRAIAHILSALDDKLELNRRMNETLEAVARALFKSWFVDFDPVRARAEGRDFQLPEPIAALFPSRFVDSELGEIPEGWEVGVLGDVLQQRAERCLASEQTVSQPYVPIECISSKSLSLTESRPGEEAQSSLTRFYKGDLLFGAMRPYFHKVCIAPFDGTTRTTAFVLLPKRPPDFAFATLLLHDPDTIDYATRHSAGSTIPYAVWLGSLELLPTVIPSSHTRASFDHIVRPMLNRISAAYFEHRTLAALRDTLLPKLISGELRVKDAEKFTQRAI
jgi:type I restriction enzyme, S subunit